MLAEEGGGRRCVSETLHLGPVQCYLIAVARLLSLLMMLGLVLTDSAGTAAALCQHESAEAHATALQSTQADIAAEAVVEEAAAAAASKEGALADAGGLQLGGYVLPSDPALPTPASLAAVHGRAADAAKRASRAVSPLLEPPLA